MRVLVVLLLGAIGGCASDHGVTIDATTAPDAAPIELRDAACPVASTQVVWYQFGYCFEAPACCEDSDCAAGWLCTQHQRCQPIDRPCDCIGRDCIAGSPCVLNEVVCGACVPARPRCTTTCAAPTDICHDGYCVDATTPCWVARPGAYP